VAGRFQTNKTFAGEKMTQEEKKNLRRKWRRWLDKIGQYLRVLLTSHDVYCELRQIVLANKEIQSPALFHNWINNNYLHTVYTGVRRLSDRDKSKRAISLYRLITDIIDHPQAMSRRGYILRYPKGMRQEGIADDHFDEFANKGRNFLSKRKIKRDLKKLAIDTIIIKNYTDKWIAHLDINRKKIKRPTLKDIEDALKSVDTIFCKYYMLLTGSYMPTRKPSLTSNWKESLKHPWIANR
jgi:hypothetical protein